MTGPTPPVPPTGPTGPGGSGPAGPTDPDEPYVQRLREADPAAGLVTDPASLRAAVADRTGMADVPDELAARRRGWTSWPARVAAVAAAALLVGGGGGYALGAAGGAGGGTSGAGDESLVAMEDSAAGAAESAGAAGGGGAPMAGPMAEGGADAASAADSRVGWWGFGHTVFTSSGLSSDGGTAHAWALDGAAVFSAETVGRVAALLGIDGAPSDADGSWVVGPQDGSGPMVSMYPDGTGSISYYDPTKDPWSCPADGGECTQRDLGAAVDGDAAAQELRDLLASLGLDPAAFEVEVGDDGGDPAWTYVSAYQLVEGARTGNAWSATWTGAGLQSLYGSLAPLVDLGEYPVISPTAAVERLGDPRFGSSGGPLMYAEDAARGAGSDAATSEIFPAPDGGTPTVPPTATPGSPLAWPVTEVTIVTARLGLGMQTAPSGAVVLAPTYELTGSDGSVWSVIAVADEALDFAS